MHGKYEADKFLIVEKDGEGVATLAVIPHWDKKEGYIHMVGCKKKYRGLVKGTKMNAEAVRILIENGFESAYLTTDDHRIPAIKSYLRAGFEPEMTESDHPERWKKIIEEIRK
jgi:mycothiol synthase